MPKENNEYSTAKIQAIQAISVALIGAIATIIGAYIASSNNSPKKEDPSPKTETVGKQKPENSPPAQTTPAAKNKHLNNQPSDNQALNLINEEVESWQTDLKDFLKQVQAQKNTLEQKIAQAETSEKYKIKDQILRLEEIEEKITVDINTLQNWLNKPKLLAQEQKELLEISHNLEKLQAELKME
jgi:prophage DNA circulation protein